MTLPARKVTAVQLHESSGTSWKGAVDPVVSAACTRNSRALGCNRGDDLSASWNELAEQLHVVRCRVVRFSVGNERSVSAVSVVNFGTKVTNF